MNKIKMLCMLAKTRKLVTNKTVHKIIVKSVLLAAKGVVFAGTVKKNVKKEYDKRFDKEDESDSKKWYDL